MSQEGIARSTSGGGGGGNVTINGDIGSITGSTLTIYAHNATQNSGSSVLFNNSGTVSTLNLTDANSNTLLGNLCGNATLSGTSNQGMGFQCLSSLTTGYANNAVGGQCLNALTTGHENTVNGSSAAISLTTGSFNVIIGYESGNAYISSESSNIVINTTATTGDNNTIRIGTQGSGDGNQNKCFIAGIVGVTTSNSEYVTINSSTGQLGVAAIPSSSITITGDSGGGLTGNSFTFTGGTTGLSFGGSGSTETLSGTLIVGNGGTGVATMTTAYAPVCAGTTATGALQVASTGLSTSGYVLTSNGSSAVPSFQAIPSQAMTWTDEAGNFNAVKNNGYFCTAALTATLPASPSQGDTISFICTTTAIVIQANTGQTISLSSTSSSSAGTATNTAAGDAITLVYRSSSTIWRALNSVGNWSLA